MCTVVGYPYVRIRWAGTYNTTHPLYEESKEKEAKLAIGVAVSPYVVESRDRIGPAGGTNKRRDGPRRTYAHKPGRRTNAAWPALRPPGLLAAVVHVHPSLFPSFLRRASWWLIRS
jgi:hypothetical protein